MKPKCANCDNEGTVLWNPPYVSPVIYCNTCLPEWYRPRVGIGEFGPPPDLPEDPPDEEDTQDE